jgi:hypothetical protein
MIIGEEHHSMNSPEFTVNNQTIVDNTLCKPSYVEFEEQD